MSQYEDKMKKTVENFASQIVGFRSGSLSPAFIDTVRVHYQGQMTPIRQLAHTAMTKNGISVIPMDPNNINAIIKTLKDSNINAYIHEKNTVMVSVPPNSGEEKQKVIAQIKKLGEESKIAIRNIRQKCKADISSLAKEDKNKEDKKIQSMTDKYVKQIDELISNKTKSL